MAACLSYTVASLCLVATPFLSAHPQEKGFCAVEERVLCSMTMLSPEAGDWVILDVDDTLLRPLHQSMQTDHTKGRDWWKPLLPLKWGSSMSLAWCSDGRCLIEPSAPRVVQTWRRKGVNVLALTARQRRLPWGGDMAKGLACQLTKLGIPLIPNQGKALRRNTISCTDGKSKVAQVLKMIRDHALISGSTVWIVDDRPDKEWQECQLSEGSPALKVCHYQHPIPSLREAPLLEVLEIGYFLKTGRWTPVPHFQSAPGLQSHRKMQSDSVAHLA
jgi:hypothetical protein